LSLPRRVVRGKVYLISRRTSERRCFLRPSKLTNQICEFCLANAARLTGVEIHLFVFLSNHFHLVVTDKEGRLPEFMHWLDEFIAKCVNASLGRWEGFWAPGSYSAVLLADHGALVGAMKYGFNNPISSGLVARAKDWPGAHSVPEDMEGPPKTVRRPSVFFRENGPVPETVDLKLSVPAALELSVAELKEIVERDAQELRRQAAAAGRCFLGRRRVLKQSPNGRPRTREPRRGLNPRVAAKDKGIRLEALRQLKAFVDAYREALTRFVSGDRGVAFPYGTYGMRVRFAVTCNGP